MSRSTAERQTSPMPKAIGARMVTQRTLQMVHSACLPLQPPTVLMQMKLQIEQIGLGTQQRVSLQFSLISPMKYMLVIKVQCQWPSIFSVTQSMINQAQMWRYLKKPRIFRANIFLQNPSFYYLLRQLQDQVFLGPREIIIKLDIPANLLSFYRLKNVQTKS